jgi:ABC-type sulfate transport system permease component
VRETLKIVIELLSAIPERVWGFIGLTVMSRLIVQTTGAPVGVNVLNGGIILALMSVPVIVSIGEDALKAVPDSFREAGWRSARRAGSSCTACCCRPRATACWRPCCWASAARWARRWPC